MSLLVFKWTPTAIMARPAANCVGLATPAAKRRKLHASSAADEVLGKAMLLELKMRRLNSVIQEAL